jgi:uncharacterized protein (TIGR02284 family)
MAEHEKMADVNEVLREIIQVLHDGHQGMAEIGHHLQDESAKQFFLKECQVRAEYAAQLENELHRAGQHDVKEGGTASGAIHRAWGDIKAHLGGGDHTLLATAEQGEDAAKKAYRDALEKKLPLDIRDLLTAQQQHILHAHDMVKSLRDGKAA